LPIHSSINSCSGGGVKAWLRGPMGRVPALAVPLRGCVGRHLANTTEMRVSGSYSYALLFLLNQVLLIKLITLHEYIVATVLPVR